jgi:hypothetical protein
MLAKTSIMRSSSSSRVSTYKSQLTLHTNSRISDSGAMRPQRRTILGAKSELLCSKTTISRKSSGIGHMYIYAFFFRTTDTMTFQNIDIFSWDTLYNMVCSQSH